MNKYPECDKLIDARDTKHSDEIGQFLEWLKRKYYLCTYQNGTEMYFPESQSIEQILADYFEIDLDKVEIERQQILKELRDGN